MSRLKLIGAVIAALTVGAMATASASAEITLWLWTPGKAGETFKGEGAKVKLQAKGGATVECKKSETKAKEGELLEEGSTKGEEATLALDIIHLSSCTSAGLAVNSLGDSSGIILAHLELHNCVISSTQLGVSMKILPLHLEIPTTKLLLSVTGEFVAEVKPLEGTSNKRWNLTINQTAGVQAIEKCEGGEKETLLTSTDGGENVQSGMAMSEGFIEFEKQAQQGRVPWVSIKNIAPGVGPRGVNSCIFAAVNEKCRLEFQNASTLELKFVSVKFEGEKANERYAKVVEGCTPNLARIAGALCIDEIENIKFEAGKINDYCITAEDVATSVKEKTCANLKT